VIAERIGAALSRVGGSRPELPEVAATERVHGVLTDELGLQRDATTMFNLEFIDRMNDAVEAHELVHDHLELLASLGSLDRVPFRR
jgi:hypothetical protein